MDDTGVASGVVHGEGAVEGIGNAAGGTGVGGLGPFINGGGREVHFMGDDWDGGVFENAFEETVGFHRRQYSKFDLGLGTVKLRKVYSRVGSTRAQKNGAGEPAPL
jgi:hypothetical protein